MENHFKGKTLFLYLSLFFSITASAQNYHAMQGSSYAGSIGVGNNPASIVNTPYAWDVNVFSTQLKYTTNAVTIYKYSLLSSPGKSEYQFDRGNYKRYLDFNFNTNLLNARISLDRKQAIAFGMNLRGYGQIRTGNYNYIDTVRQLNHVLKLNNDNTIYEVDFIQSSWIEIFGTYSRTLWDRETDRLNAGITLKAMRGISGVYGSMKDVRMQQVAPGNPPTYRLVSGSVHYGYSSSYDVLKKEKAANENVMDFLTHSEGGLSLDIGAEYMIKSQAVASFNDDEGYFDYEWKLGLALLDIGQNNFKHGVLSRSFSGVRTNVTDALLQQKFDSIHAVKTLNDSLASIVTSNTGRGRMFTIINPARMVLNIDRYLSGYIYLNAELSLNLSQLAGNDKMYVKDLNLITVTPRWETRRYGAYLPITYNTKGKLWVGGAFKAGPLLLGIHNWGNVFSGKKMANGGGYLAIVIRASNGTKGPGEKVIDCPPN